MPSIRLYVSLLILLLISSTVFATVNDFFSDTTYTRFRLTAPFAKMLEAKKAEPNFLKIKDYEFEGTLSYAENGKDVELPVEINMKGFSSVFMCDFTKLELKIKKNKKTIFAGNKKIDLNTHCYHAPEGAPPAAYEFYKSMFNAHREVVAYRILDVLGIPTFKTKAVVINYVDKDTGKPPAAAWSTDYQAFFIEDKSIFIERNNQEFEVLGKNDPFKVIELAEKKTTEQQYQFASVAENVSKFDLVQLATIEFFQALIANGDWFVKASAEDKRIIKNLAGGGDVELWNFKIFAGANGRWLAVPQDFNLSLLSFAETINPGWEKVYPYQNKYMSQLTLEQKIALKNFLLAKRENVLKPLDFLINDPLFERIKSFIPARFDILIQNLEK